MKYGVLGTGMVGVTIANRLAELGHEVMIGTRDPSQSGEKLKTKSASVKVGTFEESASFGFIVFNATQGNASLDVLKLAGEENLNGKVLVDIAVPLDFSKGMPPSLFISNTDSLAELIQRTYPKVRVVKALNTVTAAVMVNPRSIADGEHHIFVSGNDAGAKETVKGILKEFGWKHILDLGDITNARGMEMYLPLWLRMWGALGTALFNVKIVT